VQGDKERRHPPTVDLNPSPMA